MSYNFHNFLHLCSDVKKFGPVDVFSAFRFENYMTTVKKRLRKKSQPLQQLAKRSAEMQAFEKSNIAKPLVIVKQSHYDGPVMNDTQERTKQYKTLNYGSFFIDCNSQRDNCVLLKDNTVATIMNIVDFGENDIHFIGKKQTVEASLYDVPMSSHYLNIHVVCPGNNNFFLWPLQELKEKFWKIPRKQSNLSVVLPLIHTMVCDGYDS